MKKRIIKIIRRVFFGKSNRKIAPQTLEEQIYFCLVNKDDVCYDIGANDGGVAMLLSELTGKNGLIYAFEPVWKNYLLMQQYIQNHTYLQGKIVTIPIGLSNSNGALKINIPNDDYGMGSIAPVKEWASANHSTELISHECFFLTLEVFIEKTKSPIPDFIKIDVEGAELLVLHGARKMFIDGHKPLIFMELFAPWEKAFNYQPMDVFNFLIKHQYSFYFVCPDGLVEYAPTKEQQFPEEYINGYNVIAFNKELHETRIEKLVSLMRHNKNKHVLPMTPASFDNVIV